MGHIRKFNEYNSGNDYYQQILQGDYYKSSTKIWNGGDEDVHGIVLLEFDEKEIDKIKSIVVGKREEFNILYDVDIEYELPTHLSIYIFDKTRKFHLNNITIRKLQDEWYYCSMEKRMKRSYYKCDQFSGLIEFLEHNL
jgi:hypothetical protein